MSVIANGSCTADVRIAAMRLGWRMALVPKRGRNYTNGYRYHLYGQYGSMFAKTEREAIALMEDSARYRNACTSSVHA